MKNQIDDERLSGQPDTNPAVLRRHVCQSYPAAACRENMSPHTARGYGKFIEDPAHAIGTAAFKTEIF